MTSSIYEKLLAEVTDELERQVLDILIANPDRRITRQEFIVKVFEHLPEQWSNSKEDRQIRLCIEHLRVADWPIVSSSGQAGYLLEDNEEEIHKFAAEQEARATKIKQDARAAYRWIPKARAIREMRRSNLIVEQPRLM